MPVITISDKDMREVGDKLYDTIRCVIFDWQVPKKKLIFFDGEDLVPAFRGEFYDVNGNLIRCLIQVWLSDKNLVESRRVGVFDSHWTRSKDEKDKDCSPIFFLDCGGASYDNKLLKWGGGMCAPVVAGMPEDRISVHVITTSHHQLDLKKCWVKLKIMQRTGIKPRKKS